MDEVKAEPSGWGGRRSRPDRTALWALTLLLGGFPFMLLLLVLVDWSVTLAGLDPTTGPGADRVRALNVPFVLIGSLPFVGAGVLGTQAWLRSRRASGLAVAVLAAISLGGFLLLPVVVTRL